MSTELSGISRINSKQSPQNSEQGDAVNFVRSSLMTDLVRSTENFDHPKMIPIEIFLSHNDLPPERLCKAYLIHAQGSLVQFVCCKYLGIGLNQSHYLKSEAHDMVQILFDENLEREGPYIYVATIRD
jgi:hypothetical protein